MATQNHIGELWKTEQKVKFGFLIPSLLRFCKMTHTQQINPWPLIPFAKPKVSPLWGIYAIAMYLTWVRLWVDNNAYACWDWEILDLLKYKKEMLSFPQQSFLGMFMNFSLPVGSLKYHHSKFSKHLRLFEVAAKSVHEVRHWEIAVLIKMF